MPSCFHAYDIRGDAASEVTPALARALGCGLVEALGFGAVAIGHDARAGGANLAGALASGINEKGGSVINLGMCCTEEIYWAAQTLGVDGAVMVTASHNPASENGFKIARKGAVPVSRETGLDALAAYVDSMACLAPPETAAPDLPIHAGNRQAYVQWLLDYTGNRGGRSLKIVADCGNGCAGLLLKELAAKLPHELVLINPEPDGSFPHGAPNPLLPENRAATALAVFEHRADFGAAFDGDADRCLFFDHTGAFIEGYYVVGLLASALLKNRPGEKIIHDPRLYWNTERVAARAGGQAVKSLSGHAFMKDRMRAENAIYGGEMSGHHYFRDFGYCDSGMLPFLLMARLLAENGASLRGLLGKAAAEFPCSGEINRAVSNPDALLEKARKKYGAQAVRMDFQDGLDFELPHWRFSLRKSNTEPLLRLNVESRGDRALMEEKTAEILALLDE